jgi:hypothetical protein
MWMYQYIQTTFFSTPYPAGTSKILKLTFVNLDRTHPLLGITVSVGGTHTLVNIGIHSQPPSFLYHTWQTSKNAKMHEPINCPHCGKIIPEYVLKGESRRKTVTYPHFQLLKK